MAKSNNRKFRVVWMFEARDLVKTFGSVVAVNKVSFTIDKPQMIGIIVALEPESQPCFG